MKNLLEQLYAGELVPAELKIEGNEEYAVSYTHLRAHETLQKSWIKKAGKNFKMY